MPSCIGKKRSHGAASTSRTLAPEVGLVEGVRGTPRLAPPVPQPAGQPGNGTGQRVPAPRGLRMDWQLCGSGPEALQVNEEHFQKATSHPTSHMYADGGTRRQTENESAVSPAFVNDTAVSATPRESNYWRILGRYRNRRKFRTTFRTTLGGPRSRRPGSTPSGSPGGATPSPREPHAARRRRRVKSRHAFARRSAPKPGPGRPARVSEAGATCTTPQTVIPRAHRAPAPGSAARLHASPGFPTAVSGC